MTVVSVLAQGTTLTFNSSLVGNVTSFTGIGSGKASSIDITTLASTAKEYRPGLRDFGTIQVGLVRNLDDTGQAALLAAEAAQLAYTTVIVLPSGTLKTATFQSFVESLTSDAKADGVVEGVCTLRITGAVVWT